MTAPLHYVPNCNATVTVTACGAWVNTLKDFYTTRAEDTTCGQCRREVARKAKLDADWHISNPKARHATRPNTIKIIRKIDDITLTAYGAFDEASDGWTCSVKCGKKTIDVRGPVNDVWSELEDMLNVTLDFSPA